MPIEPMAVGAALAAAKNALTILRGITGTIKQMGKAEMMNDLIDLQTAILEIQQKQAELFAENQALKEENRKLQETADLRQHLKYVGKVYQISGAGNADGHYCPSCLDSQGKFIRIHPFDDAMMGGARLVL